MCLEHLLCIVDDTLCQGDFEMEDFQGDDNRESSPIIMQPGRESDGSQPIVLQPKSHNGSPSNQTSNDAGAV